MPPNTHLVRSLRSGQITLPAAFRRALRLDKAMFLQVTLQGDELRIRAYAPDQDINTAIDQAIAHLRGDCPVVMLRAQAQLQGVRYVRPRTRVLDTRARLDYYSLRH